MEKDVTYLLQFQEPKPDNFSVLHVDESDTLKADCIVSHPLAAVKWPSTGDRLGEQRQLLEISRDLCEGVWARLCRFLETLMTT